MHVNSRERRGEELETASQTILSRVFPMKGSRVREWELEVRSRRGDKSTLVC